MRNAENKPADQFFGRVTALALDLSTISIEEEVVLQIKQMGIVDEEDGPSTIAIAQLSCYEMLYQNGAVTRRSVQPPVHLLKRSDIGAIMVYERLTKDEVNVYYVPSTKELSQQPATVVDHVQAITATGLAAIAMAAVVGM